MSAAVSLADRCLDPPENTSRVVGETAGFQGRVSACRWCVLPFHARRALRITQSVELGSSKYWYCGIESPNSKYWNKD